MDYEQLKMHYETAFEIYKQSERLKDTLVRSMINEFLVMLKEECEKRNLCFVSIESINNNEMIYDFRINVSGVNIRIDLASSKLSQRKRIKTALNKVRKVIYPILAISGAEYIKAKNLGLILSTIGNVGYIKSEDYYGKCQLA